MRKWVATSHGSLILNSSPDTPPGQEIIAILPVVPFEEPIGIQGTPALLWEQLVKAPLCETDVSAGDLKLLQEFEAHGIASTNVRDSFRARAIKRPWLQSSTHELVYAWLSCAAQALEIKIIFVKGPILHAQGIRRRHHSGDIDVWVAPKDIQRFLAHLQELGWSESPDIWSGTEAYHSVTMLGHPWACDIDVHRYMPGCGLTPELAFEHLLQNSVPAEFAGVECLVPHVSMNRVLYALHELRPEFDQVPGQSRIEKIAATLADGSSDVLELAKEFDALEALRPAIELAFPNANLHFTGRVPLNWKWLTQKNRICGYLVALRMLPANQRLRFFVRVVWPSDSVVEQTNLHSGIHESDKLKARLRRFRRALFGNPRK